MKKVFEWWHSYRIIVCLLKGGRALLNNAKYNPKLNLATAARNYEWCVSTYPYVELGPVDWLVRWHLKRFKKKIEAFDFAGHNFTDGYDDAMAFYNDHDHDMGHPEIREAMANFNASPEGQQYAKDHAGILGYPEVEFPDAGVVQDPSWEVKKDG